MPEFIKKIFRRRALARHSSTTPTRLMPLRTSATINVIVDVEEGGFETLKDKIIAWGRRSGLRVNVYFFDFRKLNKNELLLTSVTTTIIRSDLNWYGLPSKDKISSLLNDKSDIFISLIDNGDFPIEFISKCTNAQFKIGRHPFPGHIYDMVISGNPEQENPPAAQVIFDKVVEFLGKISK